jgi:hypothetical protein
MVLDRDGFDVVDDGEKVSRSRNRRVLHVARKRADGKKLIEFERNGVNSWLLFNG